MPRDLAFVERAHAGAGDRLERFRQVRLTQSVARWRHVAADQKLRGSGGRCAQRGQPPLSHAPVGLVDRKSIAREDDCRLQTDCERQPAVVLGDMHQRGRCTGDAGGQHTVDRRTVDDLAIGIQVHVRRRSGRCTLTPVDHDLVSIGRTVQQPEATAAQS